MNGLRKIFIDEIGLKEQHFQDFIRLMVVRKLRKKQMLITPGIVCDFIAFINSGTMRSFVVTKNAEHNTDFYFGNYFVSAYSSFLTNLPTQSFFEAMSPCEVYCISREQYDQLVNADPDWLRFGKYIAEFILIRKCKREMSFLNLTAAERMKEMLLDYPGIEQIIPQYHIASYLGIKPESLSRIKLLDNLSEKKS